jgi:hypothetical protein
MILSLVHLLVLTICMKKLSDQYQCGMSLL